MRRILKILITRVLSIMYGLFYKFINIDGRTVLFIAYHGRGYLDNPKAIHECMIQDNRFKDYTFVWVLKNPNKVEIEGAKKVRYLSVAYFFYLAKSKYWISNCKLPAYVLKKRNQVYLQTWHGTPLKRLAHDIVVRDNQKFYRSGLSLQEMKTTYDDDVKKYTYMISPNSFSTEVFQSAFQIDRKKLIETGYPRNDELVHYDKMVIEKIKERLHLPKDKKIILYAPTWRDNSFNNMGYTFELKVNFEKWKKLLQEEYIVLFKPHYLIVNKFQNTKCLKGFLYNIDASYDINSLYLISDILITDYSSVFFDFALLQRPIYFYMYDIVEYKDMLRGFYLDVYKELPGDIIDDESLLLQQILHNEFDYERLKMFNERFNRLQDGKCAKKVVDIVFK